jgi:hypothetical protein
MHRRVGFLVVLLLSTSPAVAQDGFPPRWAAVRSGQPAALNLEISAPKSEYYLGEPIILRLSFTSSQLKEFHVSTGADDRGGFVGMGTEVLVSPAGQTEDPWRGLLEGGMAGSFLVGDVELSTTPFLSESLVNDWVRFVKPGQYRISILTRRVAHIEGTKREAVQIASNVLTLNLVAPPAEWVKAQIEQADPRALRSLDTADSAIALAAKFAFGVDVGSRSVQMALFGSAHRREVLAFLETRLTAPDQAVSHQFLDTVCALAVRVAGGRPELRTQERTEYSQRLIASLPAKHPDARVESINTLLDSLNQPGADISWLPAMVALLITDFHALSDRMQANLLEGRWSVIRSPAMLPLLHELLERQPLRDTAVRRIYDLAPEDGRQIILADLHQPVNYLSFPTLAMLPDRYLPELNDLLAERLEKGQYVDSLILRYATADIVKRVEQGYVKRNGDLDRQKLPHCGGPLVFYFLQNDPAYGEGELRRELNRPGGAPVCYDIGAQFRELDQKAWSPSLEKLAIEFLSSPSVPVKRGAAEVLGKYGSAEAQKPLWDILQYFRDWWKGRETKLNEENFQFERALRIGLAQAGNWKLGRADLNRLLSLCSSDWCRQDVREWISSKE